MELWQLIFTVVIVSASGALAPGPLFIANLLEGARYGSRAGFKVSIGHTLVEVPIVILLAFGLLTIAVQPLIQLSIGIIGGVGLVIFGFLQVKGAFQLRAVHRDFTGEEEQQSRKPLLIGLALTGLNPFFIIWWLSIGSKLIIDSILFATWSGIIVMYVSHIWMDYAWLTGTAHLAKKGKNLLNSRGYRILVFAFGLILTLFGIHFILSALHYV